MEKRSNWFWALLVLAAAAWGFSGCAGGDNDCAPVADGAYLGSNGGYYTFAKGLPLIFEAAWDCQPTGTACGAYSCSMAGNQTVSVVANGDVLTIDGQGITLTPDPGAAK